MDQLGGYGSDEESGDASLGGIEAPATPAAAPPPVPVEGPKRKKVDISKLPVSRPLNIANVKQGKAEEAPLKRMAELDSLKVGSGLSLLASLPPPRTTLGSMGSDAAAGGAASRIDLSGIGRPRAKEVPIEEHSVPVDPDVMVQKMFNVDKGQSVLNATGGDGPSAEELHLMRATKDFTRIAADDLRDPNWFMNNQVAGGPGLKGKSVPLEVSAYEKDKWAETSHANPNRVQKRKHQINWLAQEAIDKEAELLDRNASGRLTKAQTSLKYGW